MLLMTYFVMVVVMARLLYLLLVVLALILMILVPVRKLQGLSPDSLLALILLPSLMTMVVPLLYLLLSMNLLL